jgi:ketosteroid isomerase-like protein
MDEEILSLEKGAMERWRKGDPLGWAEISAEEISYVDPGLSAPILGLEAYRAYLKELEGKVNYQGSEFLNPRTVVAGEAALLSYNYRSTAYLPDGTVADQTPWNTTEVYFRHAGRWQIVHTHWSFVNQRLPGSVELPLPVQPWPGRYEGVLGELMALEARAMLRWRRGDPGGFLEISDPEVTYFDTGTPQRIDGLEALKAEYAPRTGKIHFDVMDFVDPRVHVCGDLAVLAYRFLSTWLDPDGSVARRTPWNCTEVFVRRADTWRIVHTHWSYLRGERQ